MSPAAKAGKQRQKTSLTVVPKKKGAANRDETPDALAATEEDTVH